MHCNCTIEPRQFLITQIPPGAEEYMVATVHERRVEKFETSGVIFSSMIHHHKIGFLESTWKGMGNATKGMCVCAQEKERKVLKGLNNLLAPQVGCCQVMMVSVEPREEKCKREVFLFKIFLLILIIIKRTERRKKIKEKEKEATFF